LDKAAQAKGVDLGAWEIAMRMAVLSVGAKMLGDLLEGTGAGRRDEPVVCRCGARMESRGLRTKELLTILGRVRYSRSMFLCPACGRTRYPGDEELDVVDTMFSPALRRIMARMGSKSTFKEASEDIRVCAEVAVNAKAVERVAEAVGEDMERWYTREQGEAVRRRDEHRAAADEKTIPIPTLYIEMDGTGVPMTPWALKGRKGKQPDGSARTREVKLGCVFTQTDTDEKGSAVRDPDSTSFVGKIEPAEQFGWRLYGEAVRRGLDNAEETVVLGDGAAWITGIVETHFPTATQIIDLYHAREHVSELCKVLFISDEAKTRGYRTRWWTLLDDGQVETILREAQRHLPRSGDRRKKATSEIAYLDRNKKRMRYDQFRARGLFVGSGVVEAGCKTIIGQRLKQSGMEWSLEGANAIISLRCMLKSNRLDDYWESRAA
jgi:hypothetical protein